MSNMDANQLLNGITLTDWIQAIGVLLGVPLTIWGILKLFLKDKYQEKRIQNLQDVVSIMSKQLIEMSNQSSYINRQTQLLAKSLDLNEKELKAKNKPFFEFDFSNLSANGFVIRLINTGKKAYFQKLNNLNFKNFEWNNFDLQTGKVIEEGQEFHLSAIYKPYYDNYDKSNDFRDMFTPPEEIEFELIYRDELNNNYLQKMVRNTKEWNPSRNFSISNPIEIND